ncbi:MAG: HAMP domain-containing histidine kinase [Propionibacteriaceae bacterium]|jgi:signal transduction histidine kinase|nr:HAMP domain-containing histidine kinase [Propionibacteriaceae bacterium]
MTDKGGPRLPFLWRTGLYSYRQTLGAVVISITAVSVAWIVIHFFGLWLVQDTLIANGQTDPTTIAVVQQAFLRTALIVVAAAGGSALIAAVLFTWLISRSVTSAVSRVRLVAQRISRGDHGVQVAVGSRLGAEFEALSQAFNSMARELQTVERTRARLLGDLAHEMRTPLSTLDAYLEAIGDGVEQADAETLALLRMQTARLERLASDISLVTRVEEGQVSLHKQLLLVVDLVLRQCQAQASQFHEAGLELSWDVPPRLRDVRVEGDEDRLGQVLGNLLSNARQHTPAGGAVKVVIDLPSPDSVSIAVQDDGEGIAAEHLPHLFERFYRVDTARDRTRGGSGIGLTIVRAMTAAHGGQVEVVSPGLGRGSTFTITLPVAPPRNALAETADPVAADR